MVDPAVQDFVVVIKEFREIAMTIRPNPNPNPLLLLLLTPAPLVKITKIDHKPRSYNKLPVSCPKPLLA